MVSVVAAVRWNRVDDRTVETIRSIGSSSRVVGTYSVASARNATVASRSVPSRGTTTVGTPARLAWTRRSTVSISPGQSSSMTTALGVIDAGSSSRRSIADSRSALAGHRSNVVLGGPLEEAGPKTAPGLLAPRQLR